MRNSRLQSIKNYANMIISWCHCHCPINSMQNKMNFRANKQENILLMVCLSWELLVAISRGVMVLHSSWHFGTGNLICKSILEFCAFSCDIWRLVAYSKPSLKSKKTCYRSKWRTIWYNLKRRAMSNSSSSSSTPKFWKPLLRLVAQKLLEI